MTQPPPPNKPKYAPPTMQTPIPPAPQYPTAPGQMPGPYGYQPGGYPMPAQKPSAHWPLSIIAVLGSLLFGIIALVYSAQVNSRWNAGDIEGARKASRTALIWGIVGVVVGVFLIIAVASSGGDSSSY